jgi:AAA domain-containing protein
MPFVNLANISPARVKWLWPGRLPLSYLVMLDGDPGSGKSFLTIDLCARLTDAGPPEGWPSGNG